MFAKAKIIEAVVEICRFDCEPPWPVVAECDSGFMRLYPGLSDEEIGTVMMTACVYNGIEAVPGASDMLANFLSDERVVLPGGLRFAENGKVKVIPGCCCGLEDWQGWLDVPHGNNSVWAGHDPDVWVEYINGKVRVWQDEKNEETDYIELDKNEMIALLKRVESDLAGFLIKLGKWVNLVSPELERGVVEHFAKNMNIGVQRT